MWYKYLVDVSLSADAGACLAGLRLKVDETHPQFFGCVGVVADLGVRVETEHFRRVGQRQRLDVLLGIDVKNVFLFRARFFYVFYFANVFYF